MWSKLYLVLINDLTQLGLWGHSSAYCWHLILGPGSDFTSSDWRLNLFHDHFLNFYFVPVSLDRVKVHVNDQGGAKFSWWRTVSAAVALIIWAICLGAQVVLCDPVDQSEASIDRLNQSEAAIGSARYERGEKLRFERSSERAWESPPCPCIGYINICFLSKCFGKRGINSRFSLTHLPTWSIW